MQIETLTIITLAVLVLSLIVPYVKPFFFSLSKKQRIWKWLKSEEKRLSSCPRGENENFVLAVSPNDKLLDDLEKNQFQRVIRKRSDD